MKLLSKKIMLKEHLIATVFILALAASISGLNIPPMKETFFQLGGEAPLLTLVHAQSDLSSMSLNEFQQLAKDYLSNLNDLRNQSDTDELSVVDEDNTTVVTDLIYQLGN